MSDSRPGAYVKDARVVLGTEAWMQARAFRAPVVLQDDLDAHMEEVRWSEWNAVERWLDGRIGGSWKAWAGQQGVTMPVRCDYAGGSVDGCLSQPLMLFPYDDPQHGRCVVALPMNDHGQCAGAPEVWQVRDGVEDADWFDDDVWDGYCDGPVPHMFAFERGVIGQPVVNDGTETPVEVAYAPDYHGLFDAGGNLVCPACGQPAAPQAREVF